MNDLPPLWQIAPVAVLVVWVGVWLVKRVMTLLRSAFDGQGRKGFLAAFDSSSLARSIAASASSATAIRKALAKRLSLPPEKISADTVGSQLGSYGVSRESCQIVEQILRGEEAKQHGHHAPPAADIKMTDMLKMAQELQERLPDD